MKYGQGGGGVTPLALAASFDSAIGGSPVINYDECPGVINALLQANADANITNADGQLPLHNIAGLFGREVGGQFYRNETNLAFRALLMNTTDVNRADSFSFETPMARVINSGRAQTPIVFVDAEDYAERVARISLLLEAGANVNEEAGGLLPRWWDILGWNTGAALNITEGPMMAAASLFIDRCGFVQARFLGDSDIQKAADNGAAYSDSVPLKNLVSPPLPAKCNRVGSANLTMTGSPSFAEGARYGIGGTVMDENGVGYARFQYFASVDGGATYSSLAPISDAIDALETGSEYFLSLSDFAGANTITPPRLRGVFTHTDLGGFDQTYTVSLIHSDSPAAGILTVAAAGFAAGDIISPAAAGLSDANGNLSLSSYQWQAGASGGVFADIAGATSQNYQLNENDFMPEDSLRLSVVAADPFGAEYSFVSRELLINRETQGAISLTLVGRIVTPNANVLILSAGVSDENGGGIVRNSWTLNGAPIAAASDNFYIFSEDDLTSGATITLRAFAEWRDGFGFRTTMSAALFGIACAGDQTVDGNRMCVDNVICIGDQTLQNGACVNPVCADMQQLQNGKCVDIKVQDPEQNPEQKPNPDSESDSESANESVAVAKRDSGGGHAPAFVFGGLMLVGAIGAVASGGDLSAFSFSPDFGYAINESGYSYNYRTRLDFALDNWRLYWTAGQTNRDGDFGEFSYASGGEYRSDSGLWTIAFSESVQGDSANYNFALSADYDFVSSETFGGGVWSLSPIYRFNSVLDWKESESVSHNSLNIESAMQWNRWAIRPTAGFNWRRINEFGDSARFGLSAVHRF